MDQETRDLLRRLLTGERVLSLAVVAEGEPIAGLLPFVPSPDLAALVIQASRLARHSKGLQPGARFSALIHAPDSPAVDPLQIPRVTLEGTVEPLSEDAAETEAARAAYLGRFPSAAATMELGDFAFYRLRIESGRLVAGFGRAVNLSASTLAALA